MNDSELINLGLSTGEAKESLIRHGFNELSLEKPKSVFSFVMEIVKEPMIILLLIGSLIYFFLGDPKEAAILLVSVLGVMAITIYQEQKTEKSLQALKDLASPVAEVIRDGRKIQIPAREVVIGDIIFFSEGDKIPADGKIISCSNLMVDESMLTGESVAVAKTETGQDKIENLRPGGDNLPLVFSGTLVTRGHGIAEVKTIGLKTEMGKIGQTLESLNIEKTLIQKEISRVVKAMALMGLFFCILLVIFYGFSRHDWLQAFLAGITLAMGTLPEEFPIVLTIFLTMGAWRLAQNKVLARRAATIETLGSASVLCVDKTGTLTQNKMSIEQIFAGDRLYQKNDFGQKELKEILEMGILASQKDPFDPMEKAFIDLGSKHLTKTEQELLLVKEYPLEASSLSVIHAYKQKSGFLIAAKGSPETIIDLCHLSPEENHRYNEEIIKMARDGYRIIGVAKSYYEGSELPEERHEFNFDFLGLIGLADPIREGVSEAVKLCRTAGVKVMMITGDYPETARTIARQIGFKNNAEVVTGEELAKLSQDELIQKLQSVRIFSRVLPNQKLQIVKALKDSGEIVAMTGDGVNDAPALKAAHIGIAMGQHGTEVARESAAIILLDDNFVSIVNGIRLGRRIYDNLKKAMTYIFAVHIPTIGLSLIPVIFGWPLILLPVHIVFLELIIDPTCTIVFEGEKGDGQIMERPPRKITQPIFDRQMIFISLMQGIGITLVALLMLKISTVLGMTINQSRTFVFSTLVFSNLSLSITNRSWHHGFFRTLTLKNLAFLLVSIATIAIILLAIYLPSLSDIFSFEPIKTIWVLAALLFGFLSVIWFDLYKKFFLSKFRSP